MKESKNITQDLPSLDRSEGKPLYIQLADLIRKYISENHMEPGHALPSENELIDRFGVSRITVRNAIQRLNTEGIVHKIHGKGVFVSEQRYNFIENISNIEEQIAERGLSISDELIEAGVFHPAQVYLNELGLDKGERVFKIKRLKKVEGQPFCIDVRHLPMEIAGRFTLHDLETTPEADLLSQYSDTEVHYIDYQITVDQLFEKNTSFLEAPAGTPTLIQFATYYNSPTKPVMTGKRIYLADKAKIKFKIHRNGKMLQ